MVIWEQTATCATYSINWLVFITEMKSVYSAVRTGCLNKAVCASSLEGFNQCASVRVIRCSETPSDLQWRLIKYFVIKYKTVFLTPRKFYDIKLIKFFNWNIIYCCQRSVAHTRSVTLMKGMWHMTMVGDVDRAPLLRDMRGSRSLSGRSQNLFCYPNRWRYRISFWIHLLSSWSKKVLPFIKPNYPFGH